MDSKQQALCKTTQKPRITKSDNDAFQSLKNFQIIIYGRRKIISNTSEIILVNSGQEIKLLYIHTSIIIWLLTAF
jgi:hypothetical protein